MTYSHKMFMDFHRINFDDIERTEEEKKTISGWATDKIQKMINQGSKWYMNSCRKFCKKQVERENIFNKGKMIAHLRETDNGSFVIVIEGDKEDIEKQAQEFEMFIQSQNELLFKNDAKMSKMYKLFKKKINVTALNFLQQMGIFITYRIEETK